MAVGVGEGVGRRGEETGMTVGTSVDEIGRDAAGVGDPLEGNAQARITISETDIVIKVTVWLMAFIFSSSTRLLLYGTGRRVFSRLNGHQQS